MTLFFTILAIFVVISLVMPWLQMEQINQLKDEIAKLKKQISHQKIEIPQQPPKVETSQLPLISQNLPKYTPPQNITTPQTIKVEEKESSPKISIEQRFGEKLPVWIGAIALALSGLFLVKYSIDAGILTQNARLVLGAIFGIALVGFGCVFQNKINNDKIPQALVGSGIVDLYFCTFAATTLYKIIPGFFGLGLMSIITATAIFLSLRIGATIAIFGLIGGFLSPILISSNEPNALLLFVYFYFLFLGMMLVIRKQGWWIISVPLLIISFIWVVAWNFLFHNSLDSIWLCTFLIAICTTTFAVCGKEIEEGKVENFYDLNLGKIIPYLAIGGSAFLLTLINKKSNFSYPEISFFGILSAGSIFLAQKRQKVYGFMPIISLVFSALIFLLCNNIEINEMALVMAIFAALFLASGYLIMPKAQNPKIWALLIALSAGIYYAVGYYKFYFISKESNQYFWFLIATISAAFFAFLAKKYEEQKEILATFLVTCSAFISAAILVISSNQQFLPTLLALQVCAIALVDKKLAIPSLRRIGFITFVLFVLAQIFSATNNSIYLIISAISLFSAAQIFTQNDEDDLVKYLEVGSIIMGILTAFHVGIRNEFIESKFIKRGIFNDVLCLQALFLAWFSSKSKRLTTEISSQAIMNILMLSTLLFDVLFSNPLWNHDSVGSLPIFNGLILNYLIPSITLAVICKNYFDDLYPKNLVRIFAAFLGFIFISLNIRQLFGGEYLDISAVSNSENYAYSASWLLIGIITLVIGTKTENKNLRLCALTLIAIASCKVFLFDASGLSGLYRVFSFMGLGFVLIGLSWFYSKFISNQNQK